MVSTFDICLGFYLPLHFLTHSHAPKPIVIFIMTKIMPIMMTIMIPIVMTNILPITMMDNLREVVESTRVVKVAVSSDDDNVLSDKFCISQVAQQAVK